QFNKLFSNCPVENSSGVFELNLKSQEAILSIGVYFIDSNFQYEEIILKYLLRISKSLPKAVWVDPPKWLDKDKIPTSEKFAFQFNSLLSQIIIHRPDLKDIILSSQVETLTVLSNIIKSSIDGKTICTPMILCKYIVPMFLGYCRSIGRTTPQLFLDNYDEKLKDNLFTRKFDCNLYPKVPKTETSVPAIENKPQ
uniref:Uncharacterized protein n=1 Tax=Megaselia scalaris TaxID=36166 RepID=T1GS00_MEGSC